MILDIEVVQDGGLVFIKQYGVVGCSDVWIFVDWVVVFVNECEGVNWIGELLLCVVYKMFVLKDCVLCIQVLIVEWNGFGFFVVVFVLVLEGEDFVVVVVWFDGQIVNNEKIVKEVWLGDVVGVSLLYGFEMKFVGVIGKFFNIDEVICYYDEQIVCVVLVNFFNFGGNNFKGFYVFSDVLGGFFMDFFNMIVDYIVDVVDQYVIEDFVDVNWGFEELVLCFVLVLIGECQLIIVEVIKVFIECGVFVVDELLCVYVCDCWGLFVEVFFGVIGDDNKIVVEWVCVVVEIVQKVYFVIDKVFLWQDEVCELI